ncbi:unnamed protein product [marine sediment metagenome]|uniref:Uncharacterized protein n=1 Tax=marine sediment metagenome TaxID=412755 RepID=X0ZKG9_9ZZZZ
MNTLRIEDEIFPIRVETAKAICIGTKPLGDFWIPKKALVAGNNPYSLIAAEQYSHHAPMLEAEIIADWFFRMNPKAADIFSGETYWYED